MDKKFYRTCVVVEVLSEYPYNPQTLKQVAYDIDEGDCSGVWSAVPNIEITPQEAAKNLLEQGSDPEFFGLDKDGNFLEDKGLTRPKPSEGYYINFTFDDQENLVLTPTPAFFDEIDRWQELSETALLGELLEDHVGNSDWDFINPEQIGALTSAPLLAYGPQWDNHGNLTETGYVYAFMDYQVRSVLDDLNEGSCTFQKGN